MSSNIRQTRVGIVGAGYVASRHLLALKDLPFVQTVAICDPDIEKAQKLAREFGIEKVARSLSELVTAPPDAMHILTPPSSHCALTLEALDMGCHVFVEKPMAESVEECNLMMRRAQERGRTLSVNHSMLFDPALAEALALVRKGACGDVVSMTYFRGSDYPAYAGGAIPAVYSQGSYPFRDLGVHALYIIEAFLGHVDDVRVSHGASGRDPMLSFDEWRISATHGSATATAVLSWNMRPIRNELWIHGTRGAIHVDCFLQRCEFHRTLPGPAQLQGAINGLVHAAKRLVGIPKFVVGAATGRIKPSLSIYHAVQAFHVALRDGTRPPISAEEGRRAVELVTAHSREADREKVELETARRASPTRPARILVTGASGFLGSALVRRLRDAGEEPRVLLRRPANAGSAAFGLDAVIGSLGDPDAVDRAVAGVEVVYHVGATMGGSAEDYRAGTTEGTRNVVKACHSHGVQRLVYVSSCGVFDHAGRAVGTPVNEDSRLEPRPEARGIYSGAKLEAERTVLSAINEHRLPAVILRPGQIFGPGMPFGTPNGVIGLGSNWIVYGSGNLPLPLVYVEDVVDGLLAASTSDAAVGKIINLIDPTVVDQNEYLAAMSPLLTGVKIRRVPRAVLLSAGYAFDVLAKLLRRQLPLSSYRIRSLRPLSPSDVSRARSLLSWEPRVGTRNGLRLSFTAPSIHPTRD